MENNVVTAEIIDGFCKHLKEEEKSNATIEKYLRDVKRFALYMNGQQITKELVMGFKKNLQESGLAVRSINSILASVGSLLRYMGLENCKVKSIRIQPKAYCDLDQELKKNEYVRLIEAASGNPRLKLLIQTIGGTGIRVSELAYFTTEAVKNGEICVFCKNKTRIILIPNKLKKMLLHYAKKNEIETGVIFRTRSGKPMDRSNIWREMKKLCERAGVKSSKVFPHNLRKLFAKAFYHLEKDIAKLADVLGHSNINTTRIYIMTSGAEHMRKIEKLGLVIGMGETTKVRNRRLKRKAT